MPIRVPNNLPAIETLEKENVFVMTDTRAMTQDIRPLKILLLNLMPTKIATETQLTRLLGNTPLQIDLELLQTSHESKNTSEEHMHAFYRTFDEVKDRQYDGMLITGAPIELLDFEEVDYWDELTEIFDWTKTHVHSTIYICWGAQAGLYYNYGIQKHVLPKKLSGVYRHHLDYKNGMLFRGFDDEFWVPHSRNTAVYREDIEKVPNLKILASSDEAGVFCVKSDDDKEIYVFGHSEYDGDTLYNEYVRDKNAGIDPEPPAHYFPNDDDTKTPIVKWRSCANLFYSNWLNYFVYQSTPYDITQIRNEDLAPALNRDHELTVAKFGGTSCADAGQFRKVKAIIEKDSSRRYVVVSAPGKRGSGDTKVTDLLLRAAGEMNDHGDTEAFRYAMNEVKMRFETISGDLGLDDAFDADAITGGIADAAAALHENGKDVTMFLASRGEYMSGRLMALWLGYEFIDPVSMIRFDADGNLMNVETRERISQTLKRAERAVVPGFYGRAADAEDGDPAGIVTFPRGGSDITGSLLAAALRADVYENWTDVPGMLMADPSIVKAPLTVPVINYKELRELALRGANVMHEDAVAPARRNGIPINIRSTNEPEEAGTLIVQNADFYEAVLDVSGISGRRGYASITIEKEQLSRDSEAHEKVEQILSSFGIAISGEQAGIDQLSLEVQAQPLRGCGEEICARLKEAIGADDVSIAEGLATIAVVGRNIAERQSVAVKVFEALSNERINVRFVDHGTGQISIQLGVDEVDYKRAIRAIYRAFTSR